MKTKAQEIEMLQQFTRSAGESGAENAEKLVSVNAEGNITV